MRCVTAFLLVAATALPTDGAYGQGDRVFIDVTEAAALLARPGAVVLDVGRPDSLVRAGRIPGARALPLREIVVTRNGHLNELPPVEDVARALAARGVRDGAPVLLYGEPLAAARAWLTLDVLGHGAGARILDGGLAAWRAAGRPVETGATPAAADAPGPFTPRPDLTRLVDADEVARRLGDPGTSLLDARAPGEYAGTTHAPGVPRPGHVPGARSVFWKALIESDSLPRLDPDFQLRRALAVPEGTRDVVTYCRTGMQASFLYAVARHLRLPARLYDASFADWSARGWLPVTQGSAP